MNDDWRLRVTLPDRAAARDVAERLERGELEHELADAAGDRVIVSAGAEDREVFLYTAGREQAERAAVAVRALASGQGWTLEVGLTHWHPDAEDWEDPDSPLPAGDAGRASEHQALVTREREEAAKLGWSAYEVRVSCPSHRETVELAERLRADGLACVRRWRYLLIGASDEDGARALADRLASVVPAGATVTVEGSAAAVAAGTPANPFAVFGGLGG
jgi:hypothetical protein